jgi:hypothetical protein
MAVTLTYNDSPELNIVSGAKSYLKTLELIHRELAPRLYLEVGVRNGRSLRLAGCASIGIDPEPGLSQSLRSDAKLFRRTSDDFFQSEAPHAIQDAIDFAFIDGLHRFEYALRDFINIEHYSAPASLVAVDDVFPNHPVQAKRERESRVWTGDVWKLLACLRVFRRDLIVLPVNTAPAGTLLVTGLNPASRELTENYDLIVRRYVTEGDDTPPVEILGRNGAVHPDDGRIIELLRLLKSCRDTSSGEQVVRERLVNFAEKFAS